MRKIVNFPPNTTEDPISLTHTQAERFLLLNYRFRYNEIINSLEVLQAGSDNYQQLDDNTFWHAVGKKLNDLNYKSLPKDTLLSIVASRELSRRYNPILAWLKSLPTAQLDDPIANLCDYIVLQDATDYDRLVICLKKWFVGSIKTLLTSYIHKQCIVFSGPSGIGKTPFFRSFLPTEIASDYLKNVQIFNPDNKDIMQTLTRYFIGLIDEIDKFMTDKINERNYKAMMSIDKVNDRLPYARVATMRKRIVSFLGTCNEGTFLNDPTGTQRFTTFSVKGFWNQKAGYQEQESIEFFMRKNIWQCWAWAYSQYLDGFDPEYTAQEIETNEQKNELYKYDSPEYDIVQEFLQPSSKEQEGEFLNTTQLCAYLNSRQSQIIFTSSKLGRALLRLGFKKSCLTKSGRKGYYIKKIG